MTATVEELYFQWLYRQVGNIRERNPSRSYFTLMAQLAEKEFVWTVPNDHNRLEDGRDLRRVFAEDTGVSPSRQWMGRGCSLLEMMIALSHHLSFETSQPAKTWFWKLIENLGLEELYDANYGELTHQAVEEVLDQLIERTYSYDGTGGLFPLEHPREDQREVEIWYQMAAYLLDD